MKYPKWPWIWCAICCVIWRTFLGWQSSLEEEARTIMNELERMGSLEYNIGVGLEAFVRGALGDPLGKASEEYIRTRWLEDQLVAIMANYKTASWGTALFLIGTLVLGGLGISKHIQYDRLKTR